ncbi:MAG: flippase-like domain-containing protein [Bacteroidetes bacterium]|nr:flippase-like domain-containing protein [Bacteroidota bacterium]
MKLWQHESSWQRTLVQLHEGWQSPANLWAIAALLLVPLNWLLEALKWQVLARRVNSAGLARCLQAVLAGLCLGMVTPRSLGDYAGRLLVNGGEEKVRMVGAVLLNRMLQSLSTFSGGIAGVLILIWYLGLWQSEVLAMLLLPGIVGVVAILPLTGAGSTQLIVWLQQRLGDKLISWIAVIKEYSPAELLWVNSWALLRYAVFSLQFLFLLWWAGLEGPVVILGAAIAATFLLKTLVPAFNFLSDLGVREFSALLVFSLLEMPHAEIIAASLLLWIINICLPSLAGLTIVLQIKLKNIAA